MRDIGYNSEIATREPFIILPPSKAATFGATGCCMMPMAGFGAAGFACGASFARQTQTGFYAAFGTGDFVVIINAEKIRVSGKKELGKVYYRHSGYPRFDRTPVKAVRAEHPERLLQSAVRGMLPKGPLAGDVWQT